MSGEKLKELYLKGQLEEDMCTTENLHKLLQYEIEDHRARTGNGNFEYNEIIAFCKNRLMNKPEHKVIEALGDYLERVSARKYFKKFLKKPSVLLLIISVSFCIIFTGKFLSYSIKLGMFSFGNSSNEEHYDINSVTDNVPVNRDADSYFTWLPKGYRVMFYRKEYAKYGSDSICEYSHPDKGTITLQIQEILDDTFTLYAEKNIDESINAFIVDGTRYYKSKNKNLSQIIWSEDHFYFSLYGDVNMDVLESMIRKNKK